MARRVKTSLKTAPKTLAEWNALIPHARRQVEAGIESQVGRIIRDLAEVFYPWKVDSLP